MNLTPLNPAEKDDLFCPRYLEEDEQTQITQIDGDTTITKTHNIYKKLKCSERCGLYGFRPYCISGPRGGE